ncbi:MAG: NADH-quinone oxidoreductase subunit N [Candidatus Omnitrophica bacterium]|nr:NADH-quinone oxidoreductase subunit N [Candidatus Omnitrophota bacterium]
MNQTLPNFPLSILYPEMILTISACVLIFLARAFARAHKHTLSSIAFFSVIAAMGCAGSLWNFPRWENLIEFFLIDRYAIFFKLVLLVICALTILISKRFLSDTDTERGEYYGLILLATIGMMIMVSGADLITIYLGLETMAIASYILAAYFRSDERSSEAGLKYFLLGAFNSGIILYGMALLYGATGTFNLAEMHRIVSGLSGPAELRLLYFSLILLVAGFGFKIAAVPFHMWAPDVYEGAPTPVAAFLSAGSKTASLAVLIRVFTVAFGLFTELWQLWIAYISGLTMLFGNIAALRQTNVKRMLAYSSIAHVGYMLLGLASGIEMGSSAVLMYAFVYLFANIGLFASLILLTRNGVPKESTADFSGLSRRHPLIAFAVTIFLLSLTGIPPTAGFIGKFYLFMAAVKSGYIKLAVVGVLASVISLFYYMRIVMAMYMEKPADTDAAALQPSTSLGYAFSIMVFVILAVGIYPGPLLDLARESLSSIKILS